jgi:hypothetical protein
MFTGRQAGVHRSYVGPDMLGNSPVILQRLASCASTKCPGVLIPARAVSFRKPSESARLTLLKLDSFGYIDSLVNVSYG